MKFVACYIRVSTVGTPQAVQRREINRWLKSNRISAKAVRWYIDKSATHRIRPSRICIHLLLYPLQFMHDFSLCYEVKRSRECMSGFWRL